MSQYDEDSDRFLAGEDEEPQTRQITLWQITTTDKAILFSTAPLNRSGGRKEFWIPRSVIHHISRERADLGQWQRCIVTCEDWILEKNKL